MSKKIRMKFQREIVRKLQEHEVLMSFYDDEGAEMFDQWWWEFGKHNFREYLIAEGYDYLLDDE